MSVLARIEKSARENLARRKSALPMHALSKLCREQPVTRGFALGFTRDHPGVIAEIKFASPSEGKIQEPGVEAAVRIAGSYLRNGAAALSVLTEETHFKGSLEYLAAIRRAFPQARLLLKDFVVDAYQLLEARRHGADAALLIVALLGRSRTEELLASCEELGLDALVEVHDEAELRVAQSLGASLIGINNRNLKSMDISLETSHRLAALASPESTLIAESGIQSREQMMQLKKAGFSGFLVGTSLMRSPDPGEALKGLLNGKKLESAAKRNADET